MKRFSLLFSHLLAAVLMVSALALTAQAAVITPITGEIERLTLNEPANIYSGGVIVVGGQEVILPKNLLIDLPANRLSLQQIFAQAPAACVAQGESGLAKADRCNSMGAGGNATITANRTTSGNIIAGDVFLQKGIEAISGVVTYINYTDGYFRLNGSPGSSTTGVMVRHNDPTSRHTIQSGAGCAGGPNCSPDPRFTLDPDNYTNTFSTGYPLCIPSTLSRTFPGLPGVPAGPTAAAADGSGDLLCPSTNRTPAAVLEPAVADSRRFAPLVVGDSITVEGNFETINGVRFLSAHTSQVAKALSTSTLAGQPDYLFLEEVFIEAPGFQNQRARAMWIGFTTLAPTDVDIWSIHRDPVTNAIHEFPLASVQGCDAAAGAGTCSSQGLVNAGANIFRIRYDVDFLLATDPATPGGTKDGKLSPCAHLRGSPRFAPLNICPGGAAAEFANNMGIMSPIPHEIVARTGRKLDSTPGSLVTLDVNGNQATNGEYLFPLGLNLGGIEVAEFNEIDLNKLNTPLIFEGIPWNLDRRLSPGGCLNPGGCESLGSTPLGALALDPFPFSGLDPRTQADFSVGVIQGGLPQTAYSDPNFTASTLTSARNRIFSYVSGANFNGNSTLLPCAVGIFPAGCPADPAPIAINPTPAISIFPPFADEDSATTNTGAPVIINVLLNDQAVLGTIDPASVRIATPPASGTAQVNGDGTITYTPTPTFTAATVTFTYTVANNFGSASLPGTVTVNVVSTFPITSAAAANGAISPAGVTQVVGGASQTYTITPSTGFAVAALVVDGTILPGATTYTFNNVTASHYINAYFTDQSFTVTASAGANGSISPSGAVTALYGTAASFTITPNAGFQIANLVVDGVTLPAAPSYGFTSITGNHTIVANFTNSFTITASQSANGSITPAGSTTVAGGGSQTYTVTPNAGFVVANLVVDGVTLPGATSYTFTNVAANHTIAAVFATPPTITANAAPNGTITPSGAATVAYGSSQTYTITPNAGFMVSALVVDGTKLPAATSYTFSNVTADHYINAYFEPLPATVTITANAGPNGTISPSGATVVTGGSNQTFTITPNAGFTVSALVVDGTLLPGATSYTFTNVTADHYINAYFQ